MSNSLFTDKSLRVFSRAFLPIFMTWACVTPRTAHAFAPGAIQLYGVADASALAASGGGASGAGAAGFTALSGAAAGAGLIAVGAAIGYMVVDYFADDGSMWHVRYPTTSDQNKKVPAPSAPTSASPQSKVCLKVGSVVTDHCAATFEAACTAEGGRFDGNFQYGCALFPPPTANYHNTLPGCVTYCSASASGVTSCPSGYTVDGNNQCVLTDPRAASPDKKCDFSRTNSALALISDPDCAGSGQLIPAICSEGGMSCSGTGTYNGNPYNYVISPTADGGSVINTNLQTQSGGQTQVQSQSTTIDGTGHVVQTSGTVQPGTIPATQTGAATTPETNNTQLVPQQTTFPSDYARTGEAAQAAQPLANKLDTIHSDLTTGYTAPQNIDPVQPMTDRITAMETPPTKPSVNWLPNLLPSGASACHSMAIDGDVHGGLLNGMTGQASFDVCDKLDIVREIIGYLYFVGTLVFIYRRFTRSNSGGGG